MIGKLFRGSPLPPTLNKLSKKWLKHNIYDLPLGVDFLKVATHEIGHSLGLAHSPVYGSIMFPYYKNADDHISGHYLDYDDILAMHRLYSKCGWAWEQSESKCFPPKYNLDFERMKKTMMIHQSQQRILQQNLKL